MWQKCRKKPKRTTSMTSETVPGNRLLKQDRHKSTTSDVIFSDDHITVSSAAMDRHPGKYDESCLEVSKKMIRLLRHDPAVLGEKDRAVEFRILAPMFHSKIHVFSVLVNSNMANPVLCGSILC